MDRSSLISDLEKQFSENPRRVFARLANEYRKAGDSDRAIEMCRAHIPQQPGYISGHIVLGQALFDRGELDEARQTFETALALDPENLIALRQMGDIARQRGNIAAAQDWYQRLLDVDPQNEEISAIVASMLPLASAGASSSPTPAANPMAGWGQVDTGAGFGTGATGSDKPTPASDQAPVSDRPVELLESSADLLTESPPRHDAAVSASTEGLAASEPLETFFPTEGELEIPEKASAEESSNVESGLELLDWGISSGESIVDSEPAFGIKAGLPSLEKVAGDSGEWNERLTLDDENALPEAEHSALVDHSPMRIAEMGDLAEAEPTSEEPLEADSEAREAASSYSYDPVFGRTFADTVPGTDETPAAFVTETMAELYLQQGFREEALSVYRRLVEQNPGDEELRARVAHLEQGKGESIWGFVQDDSGGEFVEQKPRTVRSFLSALAARHPSRGPSSQSAERSEPGAIQVREDSTGASASLGLFGDEGVLSEDDNAADRLSRAYSDNDPNEGGEALGQPSRAASHGLSLDDVFRDADSRSENTPSGSGFSFDQFFRDASDAQRSRESGDGAKSGSRDRQEPSKPDGSDLEAFNAWLEGLKK